MAAKEEGYFSSFDGTELFYRAWKNSPKNACIILHGHYGYNMDSPLEQRWRDVVGLEIGDGTPEIMKGIVAREAFGREYTSYRD